MTEHQITIKGLTININEGKGADQRYFEFTENFVKTKIVHKGQAIDDQQGTFVIHAYQKHEDNEGNQIGESKLINLSVTGSDYEQLYPTIEAIPAFQAIHRRALNGLLSDRYGDGFYAFNPVNNLEPIQPVVFDLEVEKQPTQSESEEGVITENSNGVIKVTVSDGSGNYEYSLDGVNWKTSSKITKRSAGTYTVHVRDAGIENAWYRKQDITLTIATNDQN